MAQTYISRLFRPKTFFHFISLRTATEFITVALLINKVEGVYGILALFTGYDLSALQLSMYVWSILVFGLVCYLGQHIRRQSALQNLALAWIYVIDTLVNAVYTSLFGLGWFVLLAQHLSPSTTEEAGISNTGDRALPPGGKTIEDTAGFTDPEKPGAAGSGIRHSIFQSGSIMSITVLSLLWFVRLYFVCVMLAYARGVLRQTAYDSSRQAHVVRKHSASETPASPLSAQPIQTSMTNPFSPSMPDGVGWKGSLGRLLVGFPGSFWLGSDEADEEWMRSADDRFRRRVSKTTLKAAPVPEGRGTQERERRARSGTGPPPPGLDVTRPSGESELRRSAEI